MGPDLERIVQRLLERQASSTESPVDTEDRTFRGRARLSDRRIRELLEKEAAD